MGCQRNTHALLAILLVLVSGTFSYDLGKKKLKNTGNVEFVNAIDNGIAAFIVANSDGSSSSGSITGDNYYTCEISSIKSVQFPEVVKDGTFANILRTNHVIVGVNSPSDKCGEEDVSSLSTLCRAFRHSLEYINNTYRHLRDNLNVTAEYEEVTGNLIDELILGNVDIVISPVRLTEEELDKGILMSCSYTRENVVGNDNDYIGFSSFLFRRDYDKNVEDEETCLGNSLLADVYNAGFMDWKANPPTGIDVLTGEPRMSYEGLIRKFYGFYGKEFQQVHVDKAVYPSLTLSQSSTAFRNVLFGHYVLVWMPGFTEKEDGYVGVSSTRGVEKTVLREVFYKISEHYGRRVEIMYKKDVEKPCGDMCGLFYNRIKYFQGEPKLKNVGILMDKTTPNSSFFKYIQFGAEFFTNTIVPVFNTKKFCHPSLPAGSGGCPIGPGPSTLINLSSDEYSSLDKLIDSSTSVCIKKDDRGTVANFIKPYYNLEDAKFKTYNITGDMITSVGSGTCDIGLTDFGAVQFYFFNNQKQGTTISTLGNVFQLSTRSVAGSTQSWINYSFDFHFAPVFKKDNDSIGNLNVSDDLSIIMSGVGAGLAAVGIVLVILSIVTPRGIASQRLLRMRSARAEKVAATAFRSTNLLVEPTFIAAKGANTTAAPAIDNDW